jgi:hypothetical protein
MRPEYEMSGGVRGKYAGLPKVVDERAYDEIFSRVGFDPSLRDVFNRICVFIESADGCDARVYRPPNMRQMRAAHVLPGDGGWKKASQVFLMIDSRLHGMVLRRRRRFGKAKDDRDCRIEVAKGLSNSTRIEASLKEWSHDWDGPRKPKTAFEWGDGDALPGGLPETNRSKF